MIVQLQRIGMIALFLHCVQYHATTKKVEFLIAENVHKLYIIEPNFV